MKRKLTFVALALCLLLTACAVQQPTAPSTPAAPLSWDQITYQSLLDSQAVLEGLKPVAAQYPQLKAYLNDAIAAYNVAQRAFKLYEASIKAPADQQAVEQNIAALAGRIITLQARLKGVAK